MNLGIKILFGWLLTAWLIPVGMAWPQRGASPLWAWARIVAAVCIFCSRTDGLVRAEFGLVDSYGRRHIHLAILRKAQEACRRNELTRWPVIAPEYLL